MDASHECRSVGGVSYEVVCHGIVEEVVPADVVPCRPENQMVIV